MSEINPLVHDYFEVGHAIEEKLRKLPELKKVASFFTINNPKDVAQYSPMAHVIFHNEPIGDTAGKGFASQVKQHWSVLISFRTPRDVKEEEKLRDEAGKLMLKIRDELKGWKPTEAAKELVHIQTVPPFYKDCAFMAFGFVFETKIIF